MALCGGVNIMLNPNHFISLSRTGMISPDGLCKAFDARADGYGRGEGGAFVVLKLLKDAIRDGDHVYVTIFVIVIVSYWSCTCADAKLWCVQVLRNASNMRQQRRPQFDAHAGAFS